MTGETSIRNNKQTTTSKKRRKKTTGIKEQGHKKKENKKREVGAKNQNSKNVQEERLIDGGVQIIKNKRGHKPRRGPGHSLETNQITLAGLGIIDTCQSLFHQCFQQ